MKRLFRLLLLLLVVGATEPLSAQYYSWGADAPMRWQQRAGEQVKVIVPDTAAQIGARTLHYIHAVQPYIGEGFTYGPLRIPFVLHPENMESNALVMYLPKRVDFLTSPAIESYSMLWTKQLVAHEYRHAVQYNNLRRGVPRVLSWFLGEQGAVLGLLFMPLWAIEGDAVMNETLMSTYGRGLQPSFSMAYRALGDRVGLSHRGKSQKNIDRWFSGSYRDHIPDHYELGYQLTSYAYDRYGENIWNKVGRYGVRNPYTFAPTHIALKKYYGTSVRALFHETFADLNRFWSPLAEEREEGERLTSLDTTNYTTYRWPIERSAEEIVALKSDLAQTERFVVIDKAGTERAVAQVGVVTTPPAIKNDTLYWTQYRRSQLFEERMTSQLYRMALAGGRPERVREAKNALYPTPSDEGLAWIEYRPDGRYALRVAGRVRVVLPVGVELHGLAYDEKTNAFYTILTDDEGMTLARIDSEGLFPLFPSAYVTISNLRAADGSLYYGSIASGRDEVYRYDLLARRAYRLSQSNYGAFDPAPTTDGVLLTRYNRHGYAVTKIYRPQGEPAEWQRIPTNLVNPSRRTWPTINLDTVRFTASDAARQEDVSPARRYAKMGHGIRVHSWAPVAFDPFRAVDEHEVDLQVGATLLSQNLLSNTEAYLAYGWNANEGSMVDLGMRYNGLGVELGFDFRYGGDQQSYSLANYNDEKGEYDYQPRPQLGSYYSTTLSAALPLLFDRASTLQRLTLSVAWNFSNGMVADLEAIEWKGSQITNLDRVGYKEGLHKLTFGVGYSGQTRLAHRDFLPRWGYQLAATYGLNPSNRNFADLYTLYGHFYMPGILPHNSIQVAASFQNSVGGYRFPNGYRPLTYRSTMLIPRGYSSAEILSDHYASFSADYRLPLCYPEWGIPSLLYIKRIRLGLGYDAARFDNRGRTQHLWSVGGELAFDFNVLRMPASATSSLTIALFRPAKGGSWISASLGLPF